MFCTAFLAIAIQSAKFLIVLYVAKFFFAISHVLSVQLQSTEIDFVRVMAEVEIIIALFESTLQREI